MFDLASVQLWSGGVLSAIVLKLVSSIDDVLWLSPFMTANISYTVRMQNASVYMAVCLLQTAIAKIIASSGKKVTESLMHGWKHAWSPEKTLTFGAGLLLAIYSVKLLYEYLYEQDEDEPEEEKEQFDSKPKDIEMQAQFQALVSKDQFYMPNASDADAEKAGYKQITQSETKGLAADKSENLPENAGVQRQTSSMSEMLRQESGRQELLRQMSPFPEDYFDPSARRASTKIEQKQKQALCVIAFIGSIDDLTLFVPMLVGKGLGYVQLISGAAFAVFVILTICVGVGLCKPVANILSSIPICLIVALFATTLLTKSVFMD